MEETVHLVVENGKGRRFTVPPEGGRLGRSAGNEFVVDKPQLSRHHCRFFFKNGELWVADLGSANGTQVNGRGVQEAQLQLGDRVRVGDTVLKVVNDGVRSALQIKKDPDFAPVDGAWSRDEEAKDRRAWVPLWIELPAWVLLAAWLLFVAYSLVFRPPGDEPPVRFMPVPAVVAPAPAVDESTSAARDETPAPMAVDRGERLVRDVARCLVQEDFGSAIERIRKESLQEEAADADAEPRLEELTSFVRDVARMNAVIATAFLSRIGKDTEIRYQGQSLTVIPRAVAGANVSLVKSGATEAVTLPVGMLDPRDRSRWLGKARTPQKNAMQFILNYEAGNFAAASAFATNCGPLSSAFAELAAERQ